MPFSFPRKTNKEAKRFNEKTQGKSGPILSITLSGQGVCRGIGRVHSHFDRSLRAMECTVFLFSHNLRQWSSVHIGRVLFAANNYFPILFSFSFTFQKAKPMNSGVSFLRQHFVCYLPLTIIILPVSASKHRNWIPTDFTRSNLCREIRCMALTTVPVGA